MRSIIFGKKSHVQNFRSQKSPAKDSKIENLEKKYFDIKFQDKKVKEAKKLKTKK